MNIKTVSLLATALLFSIGARAQQPPTAYDFRAVAQPGMTIGGHLFTPNTTIQSIDLNDKGEVAFVAVWTDSGRDYGAIFGPHGIIAQEGYTDGTRFGLVTEDCTVAISNAGQVAYSILYTSEIYDALMESGLWGIFIDKRLALSAESMKLSSRLQKPPTFVLSADGKIILKTEISASGAAASPRTPGKSGSLDRLGVKPPQLPKQLQTVIAPKPVMPRQPDRPSLIEAFPMLRTNARGQVLIPVNLGPSGFVLLLGTPVTR
jgi:hypothetical protein